MISNTLHDTDNGDDSSSTAQRSIYRVTVSKTSLTRSDVAATIWLLTAAVSLLSTKYLLTNGFHFPMHLLFLQLVGALSLRLIRCAFSWAISKDDLPSTLNILKCERSAIVLSISYILCVSGALLFSHQAINHLHNLPIVTMVLSLDWPPLEVASDETVGRSLWRARVESISSQMLVLAGITLILLFELRLSGTGVVMLLLSATLTGLSRFIFFRVKNTQTEESDQLQAAKWSCLATLDLSTLCLAGGLFSALFWCHFREQQFMRVMVYNPWTSHIPIFILNLSVTSVSFDLGSHLFRKNAFGPSVTESQWLDRQPYGRLTMSMALIGLVYCGTMLVASPPIISAWQWVGFAVASLAALSTQSDLNKFSRLSNYQTEPELEWKLIEESPEFDGGRAPTNDATRSSRIVLAIVSTLACTALLLHSTTAHFTYQSPRHGTQDRIFPSTHTLDIVIARYEEPASEVAKHINEILTVPNIQHLDTTVRIYNKGGGPKDTAKFRLRLNEILCAKMAPCPQIIAESVENIGRESHTYLRHITTRWEALTDHTIFLQADVHRGPREYTRRIQDYFVPSTGFLSLARVGVQCSSCDHCYDKDWSEEPSLLHEIYSDFNNGARCQGLVLTYRGQFIVSAARIHRNKRETYQKWLNELTNPDSQIHTSPYIDGTRSNKKDSLSAPRAGFTFERTWGVMLQCNEKRIAERCPSMLSGLVCPPSICGLANLQDCQCLD